MNSTAASNRWLRAGQPSVIAHRGQSVDTPENTMAAFQRAADLGADMIETDVNMTRDGALVLIHDASVDRTTDGRGDVRDMALREVRRLDAGALFGGEFAGLRIPTIEEALDFAQSSGVALCLEIKGRTDRESIEIALAVARLLESSGTLDRAVMAAFEHSALAAAKEAVPTLSIAPERLPELAACDPAEAVRQALAVGTEILQSHYEFITRELVAALHEIGVALWSWPTTSRESIEHSLSVGVDGLMGDDVPAMVSARATLAA